MTALLRAFAGIAMLRLDPSVLPASIALFVLTGVLSTAATAYALAVLHQDGHWFGRTMISLGFVLGFFRLLLAVRGRGHRWVQTMSAIFGTSLLLSPLWIGLLLVLVDPGMPPWLKLLMSGVYFTLYAWSLLIVAHVIQTALEVGYLLSLASSITYAIASYWIVYWIYPAPAA